MGLDGAVALPGDLAEALAARDDCLAGAGAEDESVVELDSVDKRVLRRRALAVVLAARVAAAVVEDFVERVVAGGG